MKLIIKSLKLLDALNNMRNAANVENFAASLRVPDELFWWIYLEFGTGIRGDNPTSGYTIEPVNSRMLHFFEVASGKERFAKSVFMPGIPAFHMITSIYNDILAYEKQFILDALRKSNYNLDAAKELVYLEMMPHIKEMIVESFRENLPNHDREFGRLSKTATQAFEEGLEIV